MKAVNCLWQARDGSYHTYRWQARFRNWQIARNEKKHNDAADKEVAKRLREQNANKVNK